MPIGERKALNEITVLTDEPTDKVTNTRHFAPRKYFLNHPLQKHISREYREIFCRWHLCVSLRNFKEMEKKVGYSGIWHETALIFFTDHSSYAHLLLSSSQVVNRINNIAIPLSIIFQILD